MDDVFTYKLQGKYSSDFRSGLKARLTFLPHLQDLARCVTEAGGCRSPLTIQACVMPWIIVMGVVLSKKESPSSFLVQQTNCKPLFVTADPEKLGGGAGKPQLSAFFFFSFCPNP